MDLPFVPPGPPRVGYITPDVSNLPLSDLYFCDISDLVLAGTELVEEIDSYYCPHCLQNLPSREALGYNMRCPKCYECPRCTATLTMVQASDLQYTFHCPGCRWEPGGGTLREQRPEDLVKLVLAREDASSGRTEFLRLKDKLQQKARAAKRERDLHERARRKSLTAQAEILALSAAQAPTSSPDVVFDRKNAPRVTVAELEAALAEKKNRAQKSTISASSRASTGVGTTTSLTSGEVLRLHGVIAGDAAGVAGIAAGAEESMKQPYPTRTGYLFYDKTAKPEIAGEFVSAHTWRTRGAAPIAGTPGMLKLDDGTGVRQLTDAVEIQSKIAASVYSLPAAASSSSFSSARNFRALSNLPNLVEQIALSSHTGEAVFSLQSRFVTNELWPLRKPLLTKRSKRCKYSGRIVVKPQINPCSVPPFQKENIGSKFVPHFAVSQKRTLPREGMQKSLALTTEAEVFLVVANPLEDSVMRVRIGEFSTDERTTEDILQGIVERTNAERDRQREEEGEASGEVEMGDAAAEAVSRASRRSSDAGRQSSLRGEGAVGTSKTSTSQRGTKTAITSPALYHFSSTEIQPDSEVNRAVVRMYSAKASEQEQKTSSPVGSKATASTVPLHEHKYRQMQDINPKARAFETGFQQNCLPHPTCRALASTDVDIQLPPASGMVAIASQAGGHHQEPVDKTDPAFTETNAQVVDRRGSKALLRVRLRQSGFVRRQLTRRERGKSERKTLESRESGGESGGESVDAIELQKPVIFYLRVHVDYVDAGGREHEIAFPLSVRI